MKIVRRYPKTAALLAVLVGLYVLGSLFLRATSYVTAGGQ